jgi:branched-subunit amino acid aminotransferase/4-amino-4-deoxychorismate lyase
MTREDIINLARQHGKPVQEQNAEVEYLFTLEGINALLAAEREAVIAQAIEQGFVSESYAEQFRAAIRARGNT